MIEVTAGFCVLWAFLLLILPLNFLLAAMGAALFHELCHGLAIYATGGKITRLTVGAGGMVMETTPMPPGKELVCALAGPAGSFFLASLYFRIPMVAVCGLVQACFNMLPLYPLDGGRAMKCLLEWIFPVQAERIRKFVEIWTLLFLLVVAVRAGNGAILAWGMLVMRKIPCKDGTFGVQ